MSQAYNELQKQIIADYGRTRPDQLTGPPAEIPQRPLIIFIGGAQDSQNKNLMTVYNNYTNEAHEKSYHKWTDEARIIAQISVWKSETGQPICLVGHSLGGSTAMCCAHKLSGSSETSPQIELVVTLDPVGPLGIIAPLRPTKMAPPNPFQKKPSNIKNWTNVWVELHWKDCGSIAAFLGGHWGKQSEADHDILAPGSHCSAWRMFDLIEPTIRKIGV